MTEDQAKTKWCPFARVPVEIQKEGEVDGFFVANRTTGGNGYGQCIASACVAWREKPRGLGQSEGYCGLAGRPE